MAVAKQVLEQSQAKAYDPPVFRIVPIDRIFAGRNNFRKQFHEADLKELSESIAKHGIAEPLLVRDNSKWQGKGAKRVAGLEYDLIAGERRLRAGKLAGLTEVPAMVYDVDDVTADELMVLENLQRRDLHPLEYADGFDRMIKKHGYTVEQLAKKAHKGPTFIRDLLHLAKLPDIARKALQEDVISKSVAVLIATIPDEGQRETYAKEVVKGDYNGPYSFRNAKEIKERKYMKVLSGAPFSLDVVIDRDWPFACIRCEHFAGNSESSKQGKRSDVCLNPPHYEKLVQIAAQQKIEAAELKGANVLPFADAKRLFSDPYHGEKRHRLRYEEKKYVSADDDFYDSKYNRHQYSSIIKKGGLTPVIAIDPGGHEHRLLVRSEAEAARKRLGLAERHSARSPNEIQREAERRRKNAINRLVAAEIFKQLGTSAAKGFVFGVAPKQVRQLLQVVLMTIKDADSDLCKFLCAQLGLEKAKSQYSYDYRKPLKEYVAKEVAKIDNKKLGNPRAEFLWSFLLRVLMFEKLSYLFNEWGSADSDNKQVAAVFGIDLEKIKREQSAILKAKQAEKKTPAKRAKKANAA